MKKRFCLLCAALVALLLVLALAACDGGNTPGDTTPNDNIPNTPGDDTHTHVYEVQSTAEAYLKSEATCTQAAEYYYSCACGAKGTATFESGAALGHDWNGENVCTRCDEYQDIGLVFTVNADNTTYTVTDYNGSASHVTIPKNYNGGQVISIGDFAFKDCTSVVSVTIPSTVVSIGNFAFQNCVSLAELTIPERVSIIGNFAFENCVTLKKITVTEDVASIGVKAFLGCDDVEEVIGNIFFINAIPKAKLKKITVTSADIIPAGTFADCVLLETITLPFVGAGESDTKNTHFGYIFGASSPSNNSSHVPMSLKTVVVTGGRIESYAFSGCAGLTSVTIPDSVTSIGEAAFSGCKGLTSVSIGNGVTSIGEDVFEDCTGLTSITIPSSVTSIGSDAFFGCAGLTSVSIPDSVTSIGGRAFADCTGLISVTIGNGVTSIGFAAFFGCTGLTSITIPDSVTSIVASAFFGCTGLTSVHITDLAAWCGISFSDSSANPLYYAEKLYLNGNLVTDLVIPDSVTSIGEAAFSGCKGLTSVIIPDSVTSIGEAAFSGCKGLTSVIIPDSVTSIGASAFYGCTGLTSVTIPDSVTSIGENAFYNCKGLTSIQYRGSEAQWIMISKRSNWNYNTGNYTITYNYTGE